MTNNGGIEISGFKALLKNGQTVDVDLNLPASDVIIEFTVNSEKVKCTLDKLTNSFFWTSLPAAVDVTIEED